jgi:hypothetical protein
MSVRLTDCTSIFQLGFALNAIVPTLLIALHRTALSLQNTFVQALKSPAFDLNLDDQEAAEFARFIVRGAGGFRRARQALRYPAFLMFAGVLVSFVGLWSAATHPKHEIPTVTLFVFCLFCLFVFPAIGVLYETYLRYMEDLMVRALTDKSRWSAAHIELFRRQKKIGKMLDETSKQAYDLLYEMSKNDLMREIDAVKARFNTFFKETLRHPIKSIRWVLDGPARKRREAEYIKAAQAEE